MFSYVTLNKLLRLWSRYCSSEGWVDSKESELGFWEGGDIAVPLEGNSHAPHKHYTKSHPLHALELEIKFVEDNVFFFSSIIRDKGLYLPGSTLSWQWVTDSKSHESALIRSKGMMWERGEKERERGIVVLRGCEAWKESMNRKVRKRTGWRQAVDRVLALHAQMQTGVSSFAVSRTHYLLNQIPWGTGFHVNICCLEQFHLPLSVHFQKDNIKVSEQLDFKETPSSGYT